MGSLNRVSPDALYAKAERIKHRWLVRVQLFATKPNRAKEVNCKEHVLCVDVSKASTIQIVAQLDRATRESLPARVVSSSLTNLTKH